MGRRICSETGKTKSELEKYKKNKIILSRLDEEAKEKKEAVSYSIRDNGSTLKYKKQDDNKWIRVSDSMDRGEHGKRGMKTTVLGRHRPGTLNKVLLNPWSVRNKTTAINDLITDLCIDVLCITETWLTGTDSDQPTIAAMLPEGYTLQQRARKTRGDCHCSMSQFHTEFSNFLGMLALHSDNVMIVGDLNFHLDDPVDRDSNDFGRLITAFGLQQHAQQATHQNGHTLDLVITRIDDRTVKAVEAKDYGFPDHFTVLIETVLKKNPST
ncbi:hypothetical protein CAPTEDRAFT_197363 [Capitella teleta]|uniref:Endonuclease/exonuclease/phosphatase domain-containing protein n=1 Tax=Capitella teleta TaxID=283909 RepID=R7TPU9_CAPTE|nr:hypothetical protein CAPTEDRAFT_197363 [Capitella teleta]|eukprot:ELT95684.1 hypothetical protein CAPTEDRAFT_197363 [Capitella teleta]